MHTFARFLNFRTQTFVRYGGGAAITATIVTIGMTIFEQIRNANHRHASDVNRRELQRRLTSLQEEFERSKKRAATNHTENDRPRRRRTRNTASSVASTETFRTAASNSDSEYYDLSDENSLSDEDVLNFVDRDLENESSIAHVDNALKELRRLYRQKPNDADIVWRLAKACKLKYELSPDDEDRMLYLNEGIEICEQATALDNPNPFCLKWLAILVGVRCETKSITKKIPDAKYFLETLLKTIELLPNDHLCHYLHGRYIYDLSQLPWLHRTSANQLLNNVSHYKVEDALECFQTSERLCPSTENRVYIAKCYQTMNDLENTNIWLQKANDFGLSTDPKVNDVLLELRSSCLK